MVPLAGEEPLWTAFLAGSANGTLFHDLRFLRYHPEDRFHFHHLILKREDKPIALLPGGFSGSPERAVYRSPLGASVGGLVVAPDVRGETAVEMIEAVQDYAREQGWAGVELTLPPHCYSDVNGLIEFALFSRGFYLAHRWLCHMLPIIPGPNGGYEKAFRSRQISYVRAARRRGVVGVEKGIEGLDDFLSVFRDTFARHRAAPTHTEDEIRDLLLRFPDRIRIHLAMLGKTPMAGVLIFILTAQVANTFYICRGNGHDGDRGATFIIADVIQRLAQREFRYLDLGPSASDLRFNKGVAFFKESLGAIGQCRDRWSWNVEGSC